VAIDQKETGQSREAIATGREALDWRRRFSSRIRPTRRPVPMRHMIHRMLGQAYADLEQPREALSELAQAETTHRAALAANANAADTVGDLALTLLTAR
jgi:hypothetical protein